MFHLVFLESHPIVINEAVLRDSLSLQFSDLSDVPILIGESGYNPQLMSYLHGFLVDNGSVLVLLCHLSFLLGVTLSTLQASGTAAGESTGDISSALLFACHWERMCYIKHLWISLTCLSLVVGLKLVQKPQIGPCIHAHKPACLWLFTLINCCDQKHENRTFWCRRGSNLNIRYKEHPPICQKYFCYKSNLT